jgi:hypothetical protein
MAADFFPSLGNIVKKSEKIAPVGGRPIAKRPHLWENTYVYIQTEHAQALGPLQGRTR